MSRIEGGGATFLTHFDENLMTKIVLAGMSKYFEVHRRLTSYDYFWPKLHKIFILALEIRFSECVRKRVVCRDLKM